MKRTPKIKIRINRNVQIKTTQGRKFTFNLPINLLEYFVFLEIHEIENLFIYILEVVMLRVLPFVIKKFL